MRSGQAAFEAYNAARGGKTHDGKDTPPWSALGDGVRAAWAAAEAAARGPNDVEAALAELRIACAACDVADADLRAAEDRRTAAWAVQDTAKKHLDGLVRSRLGPPPSTP